MQDPTEIPLRQYGLILAIAILGGLVSWIAKVRAGQASAYNVMQLIGELATSAFAGLMAFWLLSWANCPPILMAPLVGIAGHMGTRSIAVFEAWAEKRWTALSGEPPPKG